MKKLNWYIIAPILILFGVASYYVLTTSSLVRFWADDFCSSVLLRNNGYWQSQLIWWKGWTGRYSYIAFLDFFELFGLTGAKVLPLIQYLLILMASFPYSLLSIFFLINSPNIIQSFYWMTGSLNYTAPFIFLNLFLALLLFKDKKYFPVLGFILLFIATGFSESFGVANLIFLLLLLLIFYKRGKNKIIIYGLAATILSLGLMYLAPGNAARSATVSHPANLYELIKSTFMYTKWYLIHLFYIKTFVISVLTIIIGAFVFLDSKKKYFELPKLVIQRTLGFIIAVTLTVVGLTYQAINWEPAERVMSIVNNYIIIAVIIFSIALFQLINKYIPKRLFTPLFVISLLLLSYQVHVDWSKVKAELKNSAESATYVAVGKLDGLTDNKGWVASCIMEYNK